MKPQWVRALILISTVALAWGTLTLGGSASVSSLQPGDVAEREYRAQRSEPVVDVEATRMLRDQAAEEVEPVLQRENLNEEQVYQRVEEFFADVQAAVPAADAPNPQAPEDPQPTTTSPTTTTQPTTTSGEDGTGEEGATTTTAPVEQAVLEGFLFVDVDSDTVFEPEAPAEEQWTPDFGLANVRVVVRGPDGMERSQETGSDGRMSLTVPVGELRVAVDITDADFPPHMIPTIGAVNQVVDCVVGDCRMQSVGLGPNARPLGAQVNQLAGQYPEIDEDALQTIAQLASQDLVRAAADRPLAVEQMEEATAEELRRLFREGVSSENLSDVRGQVRSDPPFFQIDGERNDDAREAVAQVIVAFLVPNMLPDQAATEAARQQARESIEEQVVEFQTGDLIAAPNERLSQLQVDAIEQTRAATGQALREGALIAILAVLVAILAFYLARFRPQFWERPRMVALWGLLIVLAAGAVRLTLELEDQASFYILPAVAFGYLAAVLFDNRMGTLMALAVAILTATGTQDAGATVFGVLATLAPIGFVSKVSSRRAFRNSVVTTSLAVAVVAAAIAWFFDTSVEQSPLVEVLPAAGWALGGSLVASLVALAAMPFFESMFDITTTLRLLELTDRNHEALQVLQEKAFGTFNHSLMVGTLADGAARVVGANNLLVRAAAYYHDLGKTENPLYFIENQFGIPNPHDEIPPDESARIIRQHVIDGVRLAKRYKIPSEVAEGIVTHHGDAIMRYFYEKARQEQGDGVDPDQFRHAGHKPTSKEMAILMMADSVEGACRAVFGEEEPTPEAISKVVHRVIDEKVADGQLSHSDLTLGELTRVRQAFIETLVGHYHQRIPYPNFPGS